MADLQGALATYTGTLSDQVFVSVASIAAQCQTDDVGVPPFLINVVQNNCPGYFATQQQILDGAQEAAQILNQYPATVPPCLWLQYYAPLTIREWLEQPTIVIGDIIGYYRITAKAFRITGATVLPTGKVICYYGVWDVKEWIYKGKKPVIEDAGTDQTLCGPPQFDKITDGGLITIGDPSGNTRFNKGSINVTFLSDDTETSEPGPSYKQGEIFMPIPPIPDGYPALPTMPPLQGNAIVDALSDENCSEIVYRGGGFMKLEDIEADYDNSDDERKTTWAYNMDIPNWFNAGMFLSIVQNITVDEWLTVNLPNTSGGAPITLAAMKAAYEAGSTPVQQGWLSEQAVDFAKFDLIEAFELADKSSFNWLKLRDMLLKILEKGDIIHPIVEVTGNTPNPSWTWSVDTDGTIKLVMHVGRNTLGSDNKIVTMTKRYCDGDALIEVPVNVATNEVGAEITDAEYKQTVLDRLDQLQKCCNPCNEQNSDSQQALSFHANFTSEPGDPVSESPDIPGLSSVQFNVVENNMPKVVYFGPPPLQLLAKFAWRDNLGRYGEIQYINLDNTKLYAPRENTTGFLCHCYDGVWLSAIVKTQPVKSRPSPNTPVVPGP